MQLYKKHCCLSVCFKTLYKFAHTKSCSGSFLFLISVSVVICISSLFILNVARCSKVYKHHISLCSVPQVMDVLVPPHACMSRHVPSWVTELWIPNLTEHCQITVQNGCTRLHSFQPCRRVPVIQCPHQILYYLTFYFCHSHRV